MQSLVKIDRLPKSSSLRYAIVVGGVMTIISMLDAIKSNYKNLPHAKKLLNDTLENLQRTEEKFPIMLIRSHEEN